MSANGPVVDQNADCAETRLHRLDQTAKLLRAAEIRRERGGVGALVPNLGSDALRGIDRAPAMHRDPGAATPELAGDAGPGAGGGARHQHRLAAQGWIGWRHGFGSEPSRPSRIFSAVIGRSTMRQPVAAAIALATVAGGWMQGGSPTPLAP